MDSSKPNKNQIKTLVAGLKPATSTRTAAQRVVSVLKEEAAPAATVLGEVRLLDIADVTVGERYRRHLGDIPDLARSIREVGLIQPIVVDTSLRLVSGLRRLRAHEALGRKEIVARVVDLEDPLLAAIEEDRSRKGLLPTERYEITEALREKMQEQAWRRRALGGRLDAAAQKGRADDMLAKHVGISRPTLQKIRAIVDADREDPARFAAIKTALDEDGRVDRHYKRLLEERRKDDGTERHGAFVLAPNWQASDPKDLGRAVAALGLAAQAAEGALLLVPTSVARLADAILVVRRAGGEWRATAEATEPENERLWLLASFGKALPKADILAMATDGCAGGFSAVVEALEVATKGSVCNISFGEEAAL